ncbi:MAG: hypothetical protein AAGJ79_02970 [Verrucomicrobiota bacterium]
MLARLLSFAVIAFWAVMTGLLLQSVYFPDSNRFSSVDPRHIARLFFTNTDFHSLELRRGDESIADVTISGKTHESGDSSEGGGMNYELRCYGSGMLRLPDVAPQRLTTNLILHFGPAFEVEAYNLSLSFHREGVRIDILSAEAGSGFEFNVTKDGEIVASSSDGHGLPVAEEISALTEAAGIGSSEEIEKSLREFAETFEIRGTRCQLDFGSSRAPGFCLAFKLVERDDVRLYFTESGELFRADSAYDLSLVSDLMIESPAE